MRGGEGGGLKVALHLQFFLLLPSSLCHSSMLLLLCGSLLPPSVHHPPLSPLLQLVFSCGPCWPCSAGQAAVLLALGDELVDGGLVDDGLVYDGLKVGGRGGGGVLLVGWRWDGGWW